MRKKVLAAVGLASALSVATLTSTAFAQTSVGGTKAVSQTQEAASGQSGETAGDTGNAKKTRPEKPKTSADGSASTQEGKKGCPGKGRMEEVAEPENAIGKDKAKSKALTDAGVTEEQAGRVMVKVSKTDDSTVVYDVRFFYNEKCYSYRINALTGAVIEKSDEAMTEDMMKGRKGPGQKKNGTKAGKAESSAETETE
ncbi:MAG: PepSY domain-containing protein [Lachnospiraceae bacterium]|nr:PepSY domain-containing protein [Lachnospiraceae bacterium]